MIKIYSLVNWYGGGMEGVRNSYFPRMNESTKIINEAF
jgi:hypothetical protein